ncbi:UDP binding domain-containing protein [Parasphingorhabdus sp.]|uniref:UDP binding domain-containing protein n=1 Tax=Parasphingorhabdus sp. TaxID=2709688 RepID=UPI0032EAFB19
MLAFMKTVQDNDSPVRIFEAVVQVNDQRKPVMGHKVVHALNGSVRGEKVALPGLIFKPATENIKNAHSIAIAQTLIDAGTDMTVYNPEGMKLTQEIMPTVEKPDSSYDAVKDVDASVIVTERDAFRALDLKKLARVMKGDVLIDLRNIYNPSEVVQTG